MVAKVKSEKDLADAIERGEDTIEIEGSLAEKTIRIRATGKIAWAVAFGAIGVSVFAVAGIPATGGTSGAVMGVTAGGAAAVLGVPATAAAVAVSIAAGGIGVLTKIRKYEEFSRGENRLVLKRRK